MFTHFKKKKHQLQVMTIKLKNLLLPIKIISVLLVYFHSKAVSMWFLEIGFWVQILDFCRKFGISIRISA